MSIAASAVRPIREGCVKFMLLIGRDEEVWGRLSPGERQRIYADTQDLSKDLTSRGQYLGGSPLHPSSASTSVRVRDGKPLVTDGPFVETREQLGGYMLIDVPGRDEAVAIATRLALAHSTTIEVRPVREGPPT